jgi:hypothetical protein
MFNKKKQRIISVSLNSLNKLDIFEELEQKEHKKKQNKSSSYLFLLARYWLLLILFRSTYW